jgi:hypothetical protein
VSSSAPNAIQESKRTEVVTTWNAETAKLISAGNACKLSQIINCAMII